MIFTGLTKAPHWITLGLLGSTWANLSSNSALNLSGTHQWLTGAQLVLKELIFSMELTESPRAHRVLWIFFLRITETKKSFINFLKLSKNCWAHSLKWSCSRTINSLWIFFYFHLSFSSWTYSRSALQDLPSWNTGGADVFLSQPEFIPTLLYLFL